jgi:indole-3-glycerol phosphate synthase
LIDTVPGILARIVATKREEVSRNGVPLHEWERRAESRLAERRDFLKALKGKTPALIAESKKASPSKGVLCADYSPARNAAVYERGGASAMSVLTDQSYFQGSLRDLEEARASCSIPVLRKDFTIDEIQIAEAAAHGADAVLLIAAILTEAELRRFRETAARFRMSALVEVHDAAELERAIASGAGIIGVNNRDLTTFEVTLETSLRLAGMMPENVLRVSESGIHSAADVARLRDAGYSAFLVGERLMKASDPAAALRELIA